ncbi:MAG: FMN-binding negative transcriptional regulator [Leptolyngbyaceae cyanobacterium]
MYRPSAFQQDDIDKLMAFMQANSFATLVSIAGGVPCATHIPLVVRKTTEGLKLVGHLAKENPQWQAFGTAESLAIFTGPHAYVSPTLYEKPESVPTWNYIAVHAYGQPQTLTLDQAPEAMEQMIDEMIGVYEASYDAHWQSLSNKFRTGMMQGIVGFEMPVTRLEGKYKLSQNRTHAEQQNVAAALVQHADPTIHTIGIEMQHNIAPPD